MQFYGYYKCNIAFVVLWLATYFALFSNWGIMSITNALKMTIFQKSILQIQNILMAMSKLVCINKLIHMFTHFGFATQKRFKKCPSLMNLLPTYDDHHILAWVGHLIKKFKTWNTQTRFCKLESIIVLYCYILGSQPALWTALLGWDEEEEANVQKFNGKLEKYVWKK